jgi:hypothetical protein
MRVAQHPKPNGPHELVERETPAHRDVDQARVVETVVGARQFGTSRDQ